MFYGGLSNVEYTLTVTDLQTGARKAYQNPAGRFASVADVSPFGAEAPSLAASPARSAAQAAAASPELPLALGAQFQVNAGNGAATGDPVQPAVAVASDGGFMAVWSLDLSPGLFPWQTGYRSDVHGRFYDALGNPRGGEIRINETLQGAQVAPRVANDPAGDFLTVWSDGQVIRGRLFGTDGHPLGGETVLATSTSPLTQPDVIADPTGGFLVAWREQVGLQPQGTLHVRRFDDRLGAGSQAAFDANGYLGAPPRLAASPRGGFLATWSSSNPTIDAPNANLWAQWLDLSGQTVGGEIRIAVAVQGESYGVPIVYADGSFAFVWNLGLLLTNTYDGLMAQRFNADGSPAGDAVQIRHGIDDHYSTVAALPLPSGDTWVLWHETGLPQDEDGGVFSAVFDRSWALQGDISRVNSDTAGFQYDPAVAASYDGLKMAAVWARAAGPVSPPPQGGDGAGLFARRFTSAGCALDAGQLCLGGRFRVAVTFTDPRTGVPAAGQALPLTGDTGAFWFFDAGNLELVVKMLDGRPVNDHFWWFYSGLSDLDYTIAVTDTATGGQRTYHNARHHLASGADLTTFPIPVSVH